MEYKTGIDFIDKILTEKDYELLGKGMNGFALKTKIENKDTVLKFTNSTTEFQLTRKLARLQKNQKDNLNYSAEIFNQFKLSNFKFDVNSQVSSYKYLIITEYLICSDKLKKYFETNVFGTLMNYCFQNKMFISEFINMSKTTHNKILKELATDTINYNDLHQLICILKLHDKIGSGDFHSGNLGYDKNGVIKAFDFDKLQCASKFKKSKTT